MIFIALTIWDSTFWRIRDKHLIIKLSIKLLLEVFLWLSINQIQRSYILPITTNANKATSQSELEAKNTWSGDQTQENDRLVFNCLALVSQQKTSLMFSIGQQILIWHYRWNISLLHFSFKKTQTDLYY